MKVFHLVERCFSRESEMFLCSNRITSPKWDVFLIRMRYFHTTRWCSHNDELFSCNETCSLPFCSRNTGVWSCNNQMLFLIEMRYLISASCFFFLVVTHCFSHRKIFFPPLVKTRYYCVQTIPRHRFQNKLEERDQLIVFITRRIYLIQQFSQSRDIYHNNETVTGILFSCMAAMRFLIAG